MLTQETEGVCERERRCVCVCARERARASGSIVSALLNSEVRNEIGCSPELVLKQK
jgi:hypothetical protein